MPRTGVESGILTGRLTINKANFEYLIIPKRDDVDAFVTSPPDEIMADMYVINTKGMVKLLRHLYHVDFKWKLYFTPQGNMYKGFITSFRRIKIDHGNIVESLKQIEPSVEYYPFEKPPLINEAFLISLARSTGAGVGLPKRFHSIAIATHVVDGEKREPVILNLAEAFLWMQENPGKLKGIALLRSYKYAIILADDITKDELMDDILDRQNLSIQAFNNLYNRAAVPGASEEEE